MKTQNLRTQHTFCENNVKKLQSLRIRCDSQPLVGQFLQGRNRKAGLVKNFVAPKSRFKYYKLFHQ